MLLHACGGGGGGGNNNSAAAPAPPVVLANTVPITVDAGPAALTSAGLIAANQLFVTVTVCTPGTSTCRTIDHVQIDTGSTGMRLLSSTLGTVVPTPVVEPTSGRPLLECVQFADGYSFGSVATVDVTIGPRTIASLPIQVIGDPAAGTAPSSCASGPAENTVASFGANGILGIGNFLQDCGQACASRAVAGFYYVCPATGGPTTCTSTAVALTRQVPNPVARLGADNNGVVLQLPAVPEPGAVTVNGTLLFGVATQADNALNNARVYQLTGSGTFTATYNGTSIPGSFIDSGSNANFFPSGIRTCPSASFFYCPVTSGGAPTTLAQSAIVNGTNGVSATISFNVANAESLFTTNNTAFPSLGGPNGAVNGSTGAFDFGLPFFYGRNVYVIIEGSAVAGVAAPALAF